MYNPYDDDSYSDYDDYDDSHDYDQSQSNWKKFYFSFDIGAGGSLSDWIKNIIDGLKDDNTKINNIPGFPIVSFPVNTWLPNTAKGDNPYQYLGTNVYNEGIWKYKYFFEDKLGTEYVNHLRSNAVHFLKQPDYYKGLFDILN